MAYLDNKFEGRIIGRDQVTWNGRGREWAAHSCDMHVCDFYFNGQLKHLLAQGGLLNTIPELKAKFEKIIENWNLPELKRAILATTTRAKQLVKANGGHFEKYRQ